MSKVFYYNISVGLNPTWKENMFTYHSDIKLQPGTVVQVPFGKAKRFGIIRAEVVKPEITTKELLQLSDNYLILPNLTMKLLDWMNTSYPTMPGFHTQLFLPSFVSKIDIQKDSVDENGRINPRLAELTAEQQKAIQKLTSDSRPAILHGITGSGKTRVYQELATKVLNEKKNVLILYPEISLTTHIVDAFKDVVPETNLHVYHSKNTPKKQRATWLAAQESSGGHVFVGPRSALFLPLSNIGLIVVDEAHDSSYKQDTGSRYNGLMVAGALAKLSGAKLVFGSATPPVVETNYILKRGGSIVCMHSLAKSNDHDKVFERVDMTQQSSKHSASTLLSKPLIETLQNTLDSGKQSLVFLNRRGTARTVICPDCGWHSQCTRCNSPTTYHHDVHQLICHVCGLRQKIPLSCPDCGQSLQLKSPGTKAIETELKTLFPTARIMRFDSDNKISESVAENYKKIRDGGADILLGTQLITKGLDLPNLQAVGVLQAESSLFLPDFSSRERTFQQLSQVSGRVGRGHTHGRVVLQSYNPKTQLFDLVSIQDWHTFYEQELQSRKQLGFPPYRFLLKLWVHKRSETLATKAAHQLSEKLKSNHTLSILGPAPSFYPKVMGKHSWQLLVFAHNRTTLSELVKTLPNDTYYDLDPISLL